MSGQDPHLRGLSHVLIILGVLISTSTFLITDNGWITGAVAVACLALIYFKIAKK